MEALLLQSGAARQKSMGRMAHADLLGDHGLWDSEDEGEETGPLTPPPNSNRQSMQKARRASLQLATATVLTDADFGGGGSRQRSPVPSVPGTPRRNQGSNLSANRSHQDKSSHGHSSSGLRQNTSGMAGPPSSGGPSHADHYVGRTAPTPDLFDNHHRSEPNGDGMHLEPPPIPLANEQAAFGPGPVIIPNMGAMHDPNAERVLENANQPKGVLGFGKKKVTRNYRGSIKGAWETLDDENLHAQSNKRKSRRNRKWKKIKARLQRIWQQFIVLFDRFFPITHPDKPWRMLWDFLLILLVLYTLWYVPTDIGFKIPKSSSIESFGHALDAVFLADFILAFRTAYFDNRGTLIKSQKKIATHYAKTWMTPDFLSSIPWDSIIVAAAGEGQINTTFINLLKLPRLLRLTKITRFLEKFKNANFLKIIQLIGAMFFICHIMGVCYYILGKSEKDKNHVNWLEGVEVDDDVSLDYWLDAYFTALYMATMFLTGNPSEARSSAEKAYSVAMIILGACFYATVVGNMAILISNMNVTAARHKQRKAVVLDVARYLNLTPDLVARIQEYYDYLSQYSHPGPEGMSYLSDLPTSLFHDITTHLHKEKLTQVPLFQDCEEAFIDQLVLKLRHAVYMPSEVVFRFGDVGHEMYIIEKGQLAVISSTGETIAILRENNFFGELALLATARRSANVTTLSHTDLMVLTAYDLQLTMKDFPESAKKIRMAALERLSDLNVTKGGDSDDLQGIDKQAVKDHSALPATNKNIAKVAQTYFGGSDNGSKRASGSGMGGAVGDSGKSFTINAKNTSGAQLAIDTNTMGSRDSMRGSATGADKAARRASGAQAGGPGPSPLGPGGAKSAGQRGSNEGSAAPTPKEPPAESSLMQHLATAAPPARDRRGRRMSTLRTSSLGYSATENGTFTHISKGSVLHGEVAAKAEVQAAASIPGITDNVPIVDASGRRRSVMAPSQLRISEAVPGGPVPGNAVPVHRTSVENLPSRPVPTPGEAFTAPSVEIPAPAAAPPTSFSPAVNRAKSAVNFAVSAVQRDLEDDDELIARAATSKPHIERSKSTATLSRNQSRANSRGPGDSDIQMDKLTLTVSALMAEVKKMAKTQESMLRQVQAIQHGESHGALPSVLPTEIMSTPTSHLSQGARAFATVIAVARMRQKEAEADMYQARMNQHSDPRTRAIFRWKMAITKVQLKIARDKARSQRLEKARARLSQRTKPQLC